MDFPGPGKENNVRVQCQERKDKIILSFRANPDLFGRSREIYHKKIVERSLDPPVGGLGMTKNYLLSPDTVFRISKSEF